MVGLKIATVTDRSAAVAVVRLTGDLDGRTVAELDQALQKAFQESFTRLIVDLGSLKYTNSAGIGAFIKITKRIRSKGGDIVFIHVGKKTLELFRSLGLDNVFKIMTDETAARAHFLKPPAPAAR